MNALPPVRRKRRLMRYGFGTAATGLGGLFATTVLLIDGPILPAIVAATLICTTAALVLLGFGLMVVAADPFAEDQPDERR